MVRTSPARPSIHLSFRRSRSARYCRSSSARSFSRKRSAAERGTWCSMLYLSGVVRADMPAMVTPRMRQSPPAGMPWAADTGRYASPADHSDAGYLAWLARMPASSCLFATAPDVVRDAAATLELSAPLYAPIRGLGYRVALVAQDGLERLEIPWDSFDALFLGGSTEWKIGTAAAALVADARARGKWAHMGRVNSRRRLAYADAIGCDSADGTVLRFDPGRVRARGSSRSIAGRRSGAPGDDRRRSAAGRRPRASSARRAEPGDRRAARAIPRGDAGRARGSARRDPAGERAARRV